MTEVGGRSGCLEWLIDQSADCPEAEARHGQTGSGSFGGCIEADVEVG